MLLSRLCYFNNGRFVSPQLPGSSSASFVDSAFLEELPGMPSVFASIPFWTEKGEAH